MRKTILQTLEEWRIQFIVSVLYLITLILPYILILWSLYRGTYIVKTLVIALCLWYFVFVYSNGSEKTGASIWPNWSKYALHYKLIRRYLGIELYGLEYLNDDESQQYIFTLFPHGVNCDYRSLIDGLLWEKIPKLYSNCRTLGAVILFRIPFIREQVQWVGTVSCDIGTAHRLLKASKSLFIAPGGLSEQLASVYQEEHIHMHRVGYIKLALEYGIDIVPMYTFGCNDLYYTSNLFMSLRKAIEKRFYVALPLYSGRLGFTQYPIPFGFPLPVKQQICFGKPIPVTKVQSKEEMTPELIEEVRQKVIHAVRDIFETNKVRFGYGDRELHIVE